jgi:hypothetical protein
LQGVAGFGADAFVAEVRKAGGNKSLSVAQVKALREEHARMVGPLRALAAEASKLESIVADLVNAAYGLTSAEVAVLWDTAPPRMPGNPPHSRHIEKPAAK